MLIKNFKKQTTSTRCLKVANLLKKALAQGLLNGKVVFRDVDAKLFSITHVKVSADLKLATVYILPIAGYKDIKAAEEIFNDNAAVMRKFIATELSLKFVPKLRFTYDNTLDYMCKISDLLDKHI